MAIHEKWSPFIGKFYSIFNDPAQIDCQKMLFGNNVGQKPMVTMYCLLKYIQRESVKMALFINVFKKIIFIEKMFFIHKGSEFLS